MTHTRRRPRLNQPWRAVVAIVELVLAAVAVLFGIWCWHHGLARVITPVPGQASLVSTVFYGNWMAGAIGLLTLAALLILDALRNIVLALGTRQRQEPEFQPISAKSST